MAKKKFTSMSLPEKVEYLVKKNLPLQTELSTKKVTTEYTFSTSINDESNPFQFVHKEFNVIAVLENNDLSIKVLDTDKEVFSTNCSLADHELNKEVQQ